MAFLGAAFLRANGFALRFTAFALLRAGFLAVGFFRAMGLATFFVFFLVAMVIIFFDEEQ
jgi:hypothetical protein